MWVPGAVYTSSYFYKNRNTFCNETGAAWQKPPSWPPWFFMTAPSLLGMEWTSWRHFARSIFFHSSRMTSFRDWMLDGEWCSTCLFRIPHWCSIGFRSGDILGQWITFTLFFFRNPTVALDVCLGSLSSVCSVSPEAAAASGAGCLQKHWKGVVNFISPLLVNFKLSSSSQQKYGVIIRKMEQHRLGEFMNELVKGLSQNDVVTLRFFLTMKDMTGHEWRDMLCCV